MLSTPADIAASVTKLRGVYPQKQVGLYFQRVKIPGGRLTLQQWRVIAHLAAKYA